MLICMRTTLNLPDSLAEQAKSRAARDGRTLTSLVEEGLRLVLGAETGRAGSDPLPTRPLGQMLVDITDKDALWGVLDADGVR
jgi:hypothetical protein